MDFLRPYSGRLLRVPWSLDCWNVWAEAFRGHAWTTRTYNLYRALHYQKIVQNEHFVSASKPLPSVDLLTMAQGYPIEWFPSVSATIGDRYPERSVFQVFIAITSGQCKYPGPVRARTKGYDRASILTGRSLVYLDCEAECSPPEIRRRRRALSNVHLWRLDVRHLDRRP